MHKVILGLLALACLQSAEAIVGGIEAKQADFPWTADIVIGQKTCTGTVIKDTWLLTAAHCFNQDVVVVNPALMSQEEAKEKTVVHIGCSAATISSTNNRPAGCKLSQKIKRFIPHPCFRVDPNINSFAPHDNIVMVELATSAGLASYPKLDGLDGDAAVVPDDNIVLLGYGDTTSGSLAHTDKLMQVEVKAQDKTTCEARNPDDVKNKNINFDNVYCFYGSFKDTCEGDTGGAAIKAQSGTNYVVGIRLKGSQLPAQKDISVCGTGDDTGTRSSVYTSIKKYGNFIQCVINSGDFTCTDCELATTVKSCAGPWGTTGTAGEKSKCVLATASSSRSLNAGMLTVVVGAAVSLLSVARFVY